MITTLVLLKKYNNFWVFKIFFINFRNFPLSHDFITDAGQGGGIINGDGLTIKTLSFFSMTSGVIVILNLIFKMTWGIIVIIINWS